MSESMKLAAEMRERAGKGASRAVRRTGRVPAVIYGAGKPAEAIHVEEKLLVRQLSTGHFMNSVIEIEIAGGKSIRTLPRDVQFHPVSDRPIHVDFLRLTGNAVITVEVPVHFVDEDKSPGMKRGAVLNVVRHELQLDCPSNAIPDQIEISRPVVTSAIRSTSALSCCPRASFRTSTIAISPSRQWLHLRHSRAKPLMVPMSLLPKPGRKPEPGLRRDCRLSAG
jgi:large subunit ribosomal protein L25